MRPDGSWLQYAEDQAIFYPMLEMGGDHGVAIKKPLSIYNVNSQNNDVKCAPLLLIRDELIIRKRKLMCHLHDIYYLYYSEWLLIPYLRTILYITQIVVIRLQWSNRIIVCNSNNRWQKS